MAKEKATIKNNTCFGLYGFGNFPMKVKVNTLSKENSRSKAIKVNIQSMDLKNGQTSIQDKVVKFGGVKLWKDQTGTNNLINLSKEKFAEHFVILLRNSQYIPKLSSPKQSSTLENDYNIFDFIQEVEGIRNDRKCPSEPVDKRNSNCLSDVCKRKKINIILIKNF